MNRRGFIRLAVGAAVLVASLRASPLRALPGPGSDFNFHRFNIVYIEMTEGAEYPDMLFVSPEWFQQYKDALNPLQLSVIHDKERDTWTYRDCVLESDESLRAGDMIVLKQGNLSFFPDGRI